MTGASIPPGVDTVSPKEIVRVEGEKIIIETPPKKGSNIREAGEDVGRGEILDLAAYPLSPAAVGLLASLGLTELSVVRRPQVALFSTGRELVSPSEIPAPGQVVDSNSFSLVASLRALGVEPRLLGRAEDRKESIREKFFEARDADIILTTGGVSVGDYDYVKDVLKEIAAETKFWKVAIKPGKPLVFAIWEKKLIFGLPGNPVSALVNFEMVVALAIRKMMGFRDPFPKKINVVLKEDFPGAGKRLHLPRVFVRQNETGDFEASLTGAQGSGILKSLSQAQALIPLAGPRKAGSICSAFLITGGGLWR
jgi:molybdopterin molybdotransferase